MRVRVCVCVCVCAILSVCMCKRLTDAEGGGVACKDGLGGGSDIECLEELVLEVHVLGNGLDDKVAVAHRLQRGGSLRASHGK